MPDKKINDKTIDFIFDWKKRTDKYQKKFMGISIAAFIIAFILCITLMSWFQNENYERIVDQNMKYVQDSATQESNRIEASLVTAKIQVENLADQYAKLEKVYSEATIKEKLSLLNDESIFDRIAFIAPNGTDTSLEGVDYVSDRDYFKAAMNGESGWQALGESRVTHMPVVIFYAPVVVDGEIKGVLTGHYEQNRLDNLLSYQLFNYNPNTYILTGKGTVVSNLEEKNLNENMLEYLESRSFVGDVDFEEIERTIKDSSRTTITFSFVEGRNTSVGVIVQFNDSDWMIFSVLPHDITDNMVASANKTGQNLLISVIFLFIVLFCLMIFSFQKQKKSLEKEMNIATYNLELTIEEEQKQRSIIDSLIDVYSGVYYVDLIDERYTRIKEADQKIISEISEEGVAQEGLTKYINSFVSTLDQNDLNEFFDINSFTQRVEDNGSIITEYQGIDNRWRRGIIVPAGYDNDGKVISAVFAVQSIDAEKDKELMTKKALQEAYEAAQMASNAKSMFLSNMSHDIRTPMNAIIGMTAIAGANLDNKEKVSDCLKKITSSSKHLLGLINEVLDMSKIESGKVDLSDEEFSLSELIDNLILINHPLISEKNHILTVKVNNLTHEKVIGDSTRLQQVFTNLLSNAVKYTPENGKINITISEKPTNKPTVGWYEVVFQDNGIGMSEEFMQNMFDPFSRARDGRISKIQGTGLGMPIAKNIIKMMNGDIKVESELDKGSTFTVSFVLKLQPDDEIDYKRFINLPVLVADDDVDACEVTCNLLNSLEMHSEWVTSGREAVEKTVEHHNADNDYYAVILDWKMPDMNGIETAREIRKQIGSEIPIIVLTAYDWTDIEAEARSAGVTAFLSKPLFKSSVVDLFGMLMGDDRANEHKSLKEQADEHDFSGKRVLLFEDNELNKEITAELLSMVKLEVEFADNGKTGYEMFINSESGYYDLIFMDIQMPVMNGYEAASAIRASSHPDAKNIPIIAMSANAFASDVRKAYDVGMNGHIPKPIDISRVMKVLEENLK